MAKFHTTSSKITIGEALERLKENPDDPELQEFRDSIERVAFGIIEFRDLQLVPMLQITQAAVASTNRSLQQITDGINAYRNLALGISDSLQKFTYNIKVIQAYQPPAYLFDMLQGISKMYENLILPMRAIGQIYAAQNTPNLFYKIPSFREEIFTSPIEPPILSGDPEDSNFEEVLAQEGSLVNSKMIDLQGEEYLLIAKRNFHYEPDTTTFFLWQEKVSALNLSSKAGGMVDLFEIFYDFLDKKGEIRQFFTEVFVSMADIKRSFEDKHGRDISREWIKNTRSNIVKRIKTQNMSNVIEISEYDSRNKGYWLRISVSTRIPFLRPRS